MAKRKLTDRFVRTVQPPATGRVEYFDTGKTGLVLRVTARGAKSWSVYDRLVNGEKFRHTIGQYPAVTLADAHRATETALEHVRRGDDPRALKAAAEAAQAEQQADTIETIGRQFIAKHAAGRRWGELTRVMERDVIPKWGKRPMASITRRDVRELVEAIGERAPVQGNRTLTVLRIFFRWAAKRDVIPADPTAGVDKTEEKPRTRKLSDDEVRAFWRGCDALGWPFGPLLQLLLLTGARKSEIADAHWREFDSSERLLEIPAARVKSKQPHVIPLAHEALVIIANLNLIGEEPDLIFTTNAKTPVSGFSKSKTELDELMLKELRRGVDKPENVKLEPWRIHDLRRVVHSGLGKLGVLPDIRERVLGHALAGIRKVYDAHEYLDEKSDALNRWALHVRDIVSPPPAGKVLDLKRRARR